MSRTRSRSGYRSAKKQISRRRTSRSRRSMKGGGEDYVAFFGAGGGGDSAAAMIRAISEGYGRGQGAHNIVLGAGYFDDDYKRALTDPVTRDEKDRDGRKTGITFLDRPGAGKSPAALAAIDAYLRDVMEKGGYLNSFTVRPARKEVKAALFGPLLAEKNKYPMKDNADAIAAGIKTFLDTPIVSDEIDSQGSGFKYRALLDEANMVNKFVETGLCPPLTMIATLDRPVEGKNQLVYNEIRQRIVANGIRKVVLMDFGGDLLDFNVKDGVVGRDVMVLLMLLQMSRKGHIPPDVEIVIELYGLGVDAHATAREAQANLDGVLGALGVAEATDRALRGRFITALDMLHRKTLEEFGLLGLGKGRATEAYVQSFLAYYTKETTGAADIKFARQELQARPDYKKGSAGLRAAIDGLTHEDIKILAKMVQIKLTSASSDRLFNYAHAKIGDLIAPIRALVPTA